MISGMTRLLAAFACASIALPAQQTTRFNVADLLGFERAQNGRPAGWGASPTEHVSSDDQVFHGGQRSVRVERQPDSAQNFSGVTLALPVDFGGSRIQLSGFVRTEDVTGFVAIWMRLDGGSGPLAFDTIQNLNVHGTTDWKEYTISVPVRPDGRNLYFGFLLSGAGKGWADDLRLLVDGKPIAEAPKVERPKTVLDTDLEFDGGSKITFTDLTANQIEDLATLCKVWGFLKYHHPALAAGKRHWDYDLFRFLPDILTAADRVAANAAMMKLVASLGEAPACTDCAIAPAAETIYLQPDVNWIYSEGALGADLSRALQNIYRNRPAGKQFFVSQAPNVHNPNFDIEPAYARIKLPDPGFQLLGLYRYWNIIRYWAPNRDIIGEDWDKVLTEYIPKIALAKTSDDYKRHFLTLIARIHDTHANLWSSLNLRPPVGTCQVPVIVRFIENRAVVAGHFSPEAAEKSPLQRGDVIEAVDGAAVADLVKEWRPYYADSNDAAMLRDMSHNLTIGSCGDVKLRVRRGTESLDLITARVGGSVPREGLSTHDIAGDAFRLLSKDVAYIKISTLKSADVAKYIDMAAGTKGLIIDIRNYPGDFAIFQLGGVLVQKETPFARFTRGDLGNPGAFVWDGKPTALSPLKPHYSGKVVVLVDEVSQSSAEYHAMAFRAAGGVVIGSTTAGADGNVSSIPLPGGLRTMISGIGVFYPDKRPTQRVGIVPDREVKPTIAGIRDGRDEVLEAALREILGEAAPQAEIETIARAGRK
jgi:C-terminal processing protease CtpA/Prc